MTQTASDQHGEQPGLPELARRLATELGDGAPSLSTLRAWTRTGKITDAIAGMAACNAEGQRPRKLLSLRASARWLASRMGDGAPSYASLRYWETKGLIAAALTLPSGRRLYDCEALEEMLRVITRTVARTGVARPGSHDAAGDSASDDGRGLAKVLAQAPSAVPIPDASERLALSDIDDRLGGLERQIAGFACELGRLAEAVGAVVAQTGRGTTEGRDTPWIRGEIVGLAVSEAMSELTRNVQGVIKENEGLRKTVMARQDAIITDLRTRCAALEAQQKGDAPRFVGRSGMVY